MDTKIENFWTSFGTILEPILEPKNHQKINQKGDPFLDKKGGPGMGGHASPVAAGEGPIATGSELKVQDYCYYYYYTTTTTATTTTTNYSTGEGDIKAIVNSR